MQYMKPQDIERKSFEIIGNLLGAKKLDPVNEAVIKRCIHTSADLDYADNLYFSENAVPVIMESLKKGCRLVTDTRMALAGVSKPALKQLGVEAHCFISDEDVAQQALEREIPRAVVAVEKAMTLSGNVLFAVGNAPTALLRLYEAIEDGYRPEGIIAVPVGFVNVVESKEWIMKTGIPCIVARGRKGGSNIAAAVCNALLYQAVGDLR